MTTNQVEHTECSIRRRRTSGAATTTAGARPRNSNAANFYFLAAVCLAISLSSYNTMALTPSSPSRTTLPKTAAALIDNAVVSVPEKVRSESPVAVEWDKDSSIESVLKQQRRQYTPRSSGSNSKTALRMSMPSSSPSPSSPSEIEKEFEMHVGKALDTLRADYPYLLTTCPDLSIYDKNIEVVDPSGVKVHGLQTYQNSFRILHALVKFVYCPSRSKMQFRMCYDKARRNIRIHWNAAVVPREIFGGSRTTLHVDGISVYELNMKSGNIVQHRIEQLLINDSPVRPREGVIAALRDEHRVTVPSFNFQPEDAFVPSLDAFPNQILEFQLAGLGGRGGPSLPSSLFAMEASETDDASKSAKSNNNNNNAAGSSSGGSSNNLASSGGGVGGISSAASFAFDQDRFEAKNKSRKKFGLKPLTEEEFLEIDLQVQQLDTEVKQRAAAAQAAKSQQAEELQRRQKSLGGFVERLFSNVLKDTCETNWDCERPEVCCDFGFKKMCCSSGSRVANGVPQYALVPVPVETADDPRMPKPRNF